MADSNTAPALVGRLIAELFGTFVLVFGVVGAALFTGNALQVALAVGIAVLAAAYAVGHISGGHFNPAVTLGAAAAGRTTWADVVPYVLAQLVGGLLAALVLWLVAVSNGASGDLSGVSNGYAEASPGGFGLVPVIIVEFVVTLLFVWIILGVTSAGAAAGFAPLAIGLALALFHIVAIPVSNASLNPARSLATAVFGGAVPLTQLWVFILVPAVAGLVAGFTFKPLFGRSSS